VKLWFCVLLAIQVSSVVFSLSRGGFLALLAGFTVFLLIQTVRSPRSLKVGAALFIVALTAGLVCWFGLGAVKARLDTTEGTQALQRSWLPVWSRALPLVAEFPIWGTGYGTFQYVEPLHRTDALDVDITWDHAHNDYLEMLVEGGAIGLLLALLAITLEFRFGYKACRRAEHTAGSGLALGALFAFTTLVVHSLADFGIHIPAITLLATVICAHLCARGSRSRSASRERKRPEEFRSPSGTYREQPADEYCFRLGGLAPLLGAAVVVALGTLVAGAGWRAFRTDRLKTAAARLAGTADPEHLNRRLSYLDKAARLAPDDAELQFEAGYVRFTLFEKRLEERERNNQVVAAAQAVAFWPAWWFAPQNVHPALPAASAWSLAAEAHKELDAQQQNVLARTQLLPALQHYLRARDDCPLLAEAHRGIASLVQWLEKSDSRQVYL
jgi:hypothetical protein